MADSIRKRRLPKRNLNEDLETISSKQLIEIFELDHFEIREITRRDKGVDTLIELKDTESHLGIEFIVQLKATRKASGKSYQSKSIETSNLEYLLNHYQSPLYILYVAETRSYYFEWAEDFAKKLEEKRHDWHDKPTHTLRFINPLTVEKSRDIYQKVLLEGQANRRERDFVIQGDLESTTNTLHDDIPTHKSILESFQQLFSAFSSLPVLPTHVIERIPPFAASVEQQGLYSDGDSILLTENQKLIRFFENLTKTNNKISISPDEELLHLTETAKTRLIRDILNFCYRNSIHHLGNLPNKGERKRICIHKLYIYGLCNCERCHFHRLDFKGSLDKLETTKPKAAYEVLRNAYTLFELGDFKKCYQILKKSIRTFRKEKDYVSYFMCKYNLSRAYGVFRLNYFDNDRSDVLQYIKQINLDDEIYLLQKKLKVRDEIILVLKWINQGSIMNHAHRELDEKLYEIKSIHRNDKLGGWTSADSTGSLLKLFQQTTGFVESNLIMYDVLGGYSSFIEKSFEGLLMLYDLNNEHNTKLKGFSTTILKTLLLQAPPGRLEQLLAKYRIDILKFDPEEKNARTVYRLLVENLIYSFPSLDLAINADKESPNHFLSRKANDIVKNLCVLISVADLDIEDSNVVVKLLIDEIQRAEFISSSTVRYLVHVINRKVTVLSADLLEEIYVLSLTKRQFDVERIQVGMPDLFKKYHPTHKFQESLGDRVMALAKRKSLLEALTAFWPFEVPEKQYEIREYVRERIRQRFEFEEYYFAVMAGIIDYQDFWNECLESVPTTEREKESEKLFLQREKTRNRRLNLLVEITIKCGLNLSDKIFQDLVPAEPFYKWLYNIRSFDYKNFNAMWLLELHSAEIFKELVKQPEIKEALIPFVLENKVHGLVKVYNTYFNSDFK